MCKTIQRGRLRLYATASAGGCSAYQDDQRTHEAPERWLVLDACALLAVKKAGGLDNVRFTLLVRSTHCQDNNKFQAVLVRGPRRCHVDRRIIALTRFTGAEARAKVLAANITFSKPPTRSVSITHAAHLRTPRISDLASLASFTAYCSKGRSY